MEKIIKTAMGVGNTAIGVDNTAMGVENTGTYPIRDAEKLASAINNLANAIDRLSEQPEEKALHLPMTSKDLKEARKELQEDTPEKWEEERYLDKILVNLLTDKKIQELVADYKFTADWQEAKRVEAVMGIKEYLFNGIKLKIEQLLEEIEYRARKDECEKLIETFDNLKYKEDNGDTDWVDKNFILGVLKDELSKLKDKKDE